MCNWLLQGRHDAESLRRFVEHEDRFMAATGLDKQRLQVSLISPSYLNAGACERALELLANAEACFRPDLYDAALGASGRAPSSPADGIGAFVGPKFDADNIAGYLAAFKCPEENS